MSWLGNGRRGRLMVSHRERDGDRLTRGEREGRETNERRCEREREREREWEERLSLSFSIV